MTVEAIGNLTHLAPDDALQRQSCRPVFVFHSPDDRIVDAVSVSVFRHVYPVFFRDLHDRTSGNFIDQRMRHVAIFTDGTCHLNTDVVRLVLQIRTVVILQCLEAVVHQVDQRLAGIPLEKCRIVFRSSSFRHDTEIKINRISKIRYFFRFRPL